MSVGLNTDAISQRWPVARCCEPGITRVDWAAAEKSATTIGGIGDPALQIENTPGQRPRPSASEVLVAAELQAEDASQIAGMIPDFHQVPHEQVLAGQQEKGQEEEVEGQGDDGFQHAA